MRFRFDVVLGRAAPQTLTVEAASLNEAKLRLTQQGYSVLSATELSTSTFVGGTLGVHVRPQIGRVSNRELSIFVEQLHALLHAGLSVIEALDTLQKGAYGSWAEVIALIVNQLRQGQTLSNALEHQAIFPALLIALVRSAELTSDLPQALARFLEHQQRSEQVRHQLTSVALYPLLLMTVGGCVILFLLLYVMPRFARVFEGMSNLPSSAQAMVSWSHLLKAHGLDLMIAAGVVVAGITSVLALPSSRARLFGRVLRIQPLGSASAHLLFGSLVSHQWHAG
jgi:general secretion pathway protein F